MVHQAINALRAHVFSFEVGDIGGAVAENTCGLVLFENDLVAFHVDFQRIPFVDIQRATQFDRQNDASKLVNFSYNSGRFQYDSPPSITVNVDIYNIPEKSGFVKRLQKLRNDL